MKTQSAKVVARYRSKQSIPEDCPLRAFLDGTKTSNTTKSKGNNRNGSNNRRRTGKKRKQGKKGHNTGTGKGTKHKCEERVQNNGSDVTQNGENIADNPPESSEHMGDDAIVIDLVSDSEDESTVSKKFGNESSELHRDYTATVECINIDENPFYSSDEDSFEQHDKAQPPTKRAKYL